ncbi:Vacuolar protein sorting-associated protein 35A [Camellia lanceoleosa]|uniref:Vacuolar protein sorting-associated protein 35A n=1 Tax=Camellia lanceoleosa TaxID=1840588 RepID=A0ACC0IHQ4_9ERIC|nr:Vacuolar protein sorting-associated protein 35A [Camellia lanceoleosa]
MKDFSKTKEKENDREWNRRRGHMAHRRHRRDSTQYFLYASHTDMQAFDELRRLEIFFKEEDKYGCTVSDLYELVQYTGNILPRLSLGYWNRICEPEIAVSSVKSSASVSSRLQQKNLELEKRSRLPIPPDSSNSRRQPNKQQPELSFPDGVLPEFGSVAPEHPSPVSILDDTMYRDDALSLVKQMPDVLKGSNGKRQSYPPTISTRPVLQRQNILAKICANHGAYEEFVSRSSSINIEYEAKACDTQACPICYAEVFGDASKH